MIYGDAVRVGNTLCPPADLQFELDHWRHEIETIRDNSYGARLRQFLVVKERLPTLIENLNGQPVVYVAAFDNWCGERDSQSVWFLQKHLHKFMPAHPEGYAHGDTFGVDFDGRTPLPANSERSCWLCQWTFPPANDYEVVFREYIKGGSGMVVDEESKAEWRFPIMKTDVLNDADLAQKE